MERKIGEIFIYKDKTYQVVEVETDEECKGCAFEFSSCCTSSLGDCSPAHRTDGASVIFKAINNMEIKNNQLIIDIPEGMEIDTENSSLAEGIIKLKPKNITYSKIVNSFNSITNTNVYIHSSDTKALKTIAQLMNIAKYYNGDWEPDWNNQDEYKYYITYNRDTYEVDYNWMTICSNIYFKNKEDAQSVIDNPNFRAILNAIYKN